LPFAGSAIDDGPDSFLRSLADKTFYYPPEFLSGASERRPLEGHRLIEDMSWGNHPLKYRAGIPLRGAACGEQAMGLAQAQAIAGLVAD